MISLTPDLDRAVKQLGWTTFTPVQELSIPPLRAGRDLFAQAQTGTGKTGAFALPILERVEGRAGAPLPDRAAARRPIGVCRATEDLPRSTTHTRRGEPRRHPDQHRAEHLQPELVHEVDSSAREPDSDYFFAWVAYELDD